MVRLFALVILIGASGCTSLPLDRTREMHVEIVAPAAREVAYIAAGQKTRPYILNTCELIRGQQRPKCKGDELQGAEKLLIPVLLPILVVQRAIDGAGQKERAESDDSTPVEAKEQAAYIRDSIKSEISSMEKGLLHAFKVSLGWNTQGRTPVIADPAKGSVRLALHRVELIENENRTQTVLLCALGMVGTNDSSRRFFYACGSESLDRRARFSKGADVAVFQSRLRLATEKLAEAMAQALAGPALTARRPGMPPN